MPPIESPFSEVVLGTSFVAPLFSVFDYGVLAERLKEKYPVRSTQLPIPIQADFGPQVLMPQLPRIWLESEDGHRLVQLQQDRFLFNWKRVEKRGAYPHFAALYLEFVEGWSAYKEIVATLGEGVLEPQRFECSYINNISQDLRETVKGPMFRFESSGWNTFLPSPALRLLQYTFNFEPADLKLRITTRPGIDLALQRDVIALQLDAVSTSTGLDMDLWFARAHDIINKSFEDILTEEALAVWRQIEND